MLLFKFNGFYRTYACDNVRRAYQHGHGNSKCCHVEQNKISDVERYGHGRNVVDLGVEPDDVEEVLQQAQGDAGNITPQHCRVPTRNRAT